LIAEAVWSIEVAEQNYFRWRAEGYDSYDGAWVASSRYPNNVGSRDFAEARTHDGKKFRMLLRSQTSQRATGEHRDS
jgi:hypothetical protein